MKILVDSEGRDAIAQTCDDSLKAGGIRNMRSVHQVLASVQMITDEPPVPPAPATIKSPDEGLAIEEGV